MSPESTDSTLVYIMDDDASVRSALSRLLRSAGLNPLPFDSAERFLEEVVDSTEACILLDISMPRMSGLRVHARLNERGITTPVITLSARDDNEIREFSRKLGACMYLRKPVDDQALLDAISWATRRAAPMHPVRAQDMTGR